MVLYQARQLPFPGRPCHVPLRRQGESREARLAHIVIPEPYANFIVEPIVIDLTGQPDGNSDEIQSPGSDATGLRDVAAPLAGSLGGNEPLHPEQPERTSTASTSSTVVITSAEFKDMHRKILAEKAGDDQRSQRSPRDPGSAQTARKGPIPLGASSGQDAGYSTVWKTKELGFQPGAPEARPSRGPHLRHRRESGPPCSKPL